MNCVSPCGLSVSIFSVTAVVISSVDECSFGGDEGLEAVTSKISSEEITLLVLLPLRFLYCVSLYSTVGLRALKLYLFVPSRIDIEC